MKKLLSILSVLTLTAIIPAPLLANTVQTRVKRDVGATAKDVTTGFNIKIKEKWEYWTKIDTNNSNWISNNEFSSNKNKWYIMFAIIKGESLLNLRAIKFKNDDINKPQSLGNQGNFIVWSGKQYWFNWLYRWYGVEEPNLPEIDKNGNILDWKLPKISDFQKGISFSLAENDKTATWSNAGMRLTVDGETNINIDNKNMEEVYWDGVKQPQTSKQWKINVKPETAPRDHKLVIKYDINGIKYTSEDITVSMLAKIDPPIPSKQENLSDVIKFGDENNLGNIVDNNDSTIFSAITQKNARIVDFSQITIEKKDNNSATLTAKPDSKSYKGSVDVKYNVVPATTVDLKIDVKPTAGTTQPDSDYLSQLDSSKMTNPVNTFYYASSESVITMVKQTPSSVITGVVYGCDEQWNKTSQSSNISPTNGIKLDGGQLGANNGKYLIELENELKQKNIIYLQIAPNQTKEHYFDTTNGKNFEIWANDNGYDNIRGYGASQLNKLFELSKTWKQSLAHLDLKLDNFVVDNIKNVIQDEIDNYKAKMLASVKVQVEKYIPNVVENTDYVISIDNFVAGDWTTSKDVKVQAVDGSTKLLSFTVKTIPIQEKTQPIPPAPDNKKDGDSKLWIIGVVVGVLAGLGLAYWLFKRFVFDKYFLPKIKKNRHNKLVEQVRKEEAEKDAQKK